MKLILEKEKFLQALQTVNNIISNRTTLPVLGNFLLKAADNTVTLSATDLDTGIRTNLEAKTEKQGSITLPARKMLNIVRELPAAELTLEIDNKNQATIKSGTALFKIMGLPEEDFPALPQNQGQFIYKIDQPILREMLKKTSYSMSTDEGRYVLNGALLSFKDGKLTIVTTDGRRLALVDQELEFPKASEKEVILPSKAVHELQRILADSGTVTIGIAENQITFQLETIYLISKLIEGNYPDYRQVIPADAKERVTMERELLLNAVRRVALLSSDKSNSVKFHLTKNNLDITANTPDVGEAKETMPVNYKGRDLTIAFNPDYFCDPLRALDGDEVHLDLSDDRNPGIIRYNKPFLYVIMPMRTN